MKEARPTRRRPRRKCVCGHRAARHPGWDQGFARCVICTCPDYVGRLTRGQMKSGGKS